MNYQELKTKIEEVIENTSLDEFVNEDFDKNLLPSFTIVHTEGDCEGGGEYSEKVFRFTEDNLYVKFTGFYTSYEGTDWDGDFNQVFRFQKFIQSYATALVYTTIFRQFAPFG